MTVAPLPIDSVLPSFLDALRATPAVVLQAAPGAGKTTRVPPAILDAHLIGEQKILVLQPRRVAARASAARIAAERASVVGDEIGYQVRFDSQVSARTRLAVITEGILLKRLLDDPFLPDIGAVIFDEFHERSLASELALAMVRQIQRSVRPDLKIVVMSATLSTQPIARYLDHCPIVESQGVAFPVAVSYLPHLDRRPLEVLVCEGVAQLLDRTAGDCLVFLPGVGEIRQCGRRLARLAELRDLRLAELYGDLPSEAQDAVLRAGNKRKVILATNVAETSLTIEGITGVVDSGLARMLMFDEATGLDRLELLPISRAAADQRAGRAGRTQPGACLRLWPEAVHRSRRDYELPEIQRVDLAGALLQVLCWVEPEIAMFPWFEPPSPERLQTAEALLVRLGAAKDGKVTSMGRRLAALPVHPRLGRLLIEGASRGCANEASLAAALLSERDPFVLPERTLRRRSANTRSRSDCLDRVQALEQFDTSQVTESELGTLQVTAARHILRTRDQLLRLIRQESKQATGTRPNSENAFLRSLLCAYPDRLAKAREPNSRRALMVGGRGVRLADESALADEELFVCVDVNAVSGEAIVRQASAVERAWLPEDQLETRTLIEFDEATEKVAARRVLRFADLVLEESQAALPGSEELARVLVQAAESRLERVFPSDDEAIGQFRERVRCLASWMPDLGLPALDDSQLRELLPQLAAGRRSFAELRSAPWLDALRNLFTWQQLQAIEREAPERIEVPSGSHIRVEYEFGRPPVMAVRVQEVFGMLETPRIAGKRVAVLVHLLAPNMRVAQVTDDLASFWKTTYAMVRKDLRARYPKHAWPEDPYTAKAERRPTRKRS